MTDKRQHDLETLSAYIDGALAGDESRRLEARLGAEPELRAELEGLLRTRDLLRSAPHYAAPRNFTLTPEMAGERAGKPGAMFGLARLAFAFTTILFAVALVGSFTFQGGALSQPEAITAFEAEAIEEAESAAEPLPATGDETSDVQVEEMVESMEALEEAASAPAEGSSGGDGETQQDAASPEESAESGLAPEAESTGAGESFAPPELESQAEEGTDTEPTAPEVTAEDDHQRAAEEAAAVEATPDLPGETTPEPLPDDAAQVLPETSPVEPERARQVNFWSIFVFLTAAAAIFSGVLTWYLRRR